jgi:hypothetical protein
MTTEKIMLYKISLISSLIITAYSGSTFADEQSQEDTMLEACIVDITDESNKYCLPAGQRSGYRLPSNIYNKQVKVEVKNGLAVMLSDWDNLSYNRLGVFYENTNNSDLKSVVARNGKTLDFSHPRSMRVLSTNKVMSDLSVDHLGADYKVDDKIIVTLMNKEDNTILSTLDIIVTEENKNNLSKAVAMAINDSWSGKGLKAGKREINGSINVSSNGDNFLYGSADNMGVSIAQQCDIGLFAVESHSKTKTSIIYRVNTKSGVSAKLVDTGFNSSNLALYDDALYMIEKTGSEGHAAQILSYDIANGDKQVMSTTDTYKIIRSAFNEQNGTLKATSKTYLYDFDINTGEKTVIGKLKYQGDDFKNGDLAYVGDTLYVLTGKALYSVDESTLELTKMGEHGVNWASGLAVDPRGTLYISGRKKNEKAKIYTIDKTTAEATELTTLTHRVTDLAFSKSFCNVN